MNSISIVGRLGSPAQEASSDQTRKAALRIAVDRPAKGAKPDWFDVVVWGQNAEFALGMLRTGDKVAVVGAMRSHEEGRSVHWVLQARELWLVARGQDAS